MWKMSFAHDPLHDVVTATFTDCVLTTPADVARWRREVEQELGRFGKKIDLLINLDGLVVKPGASRSFGRERREVLAKYTIRSFRYGGDTQSRTSIFTSAVIDGAAANVYESRDQALAALLETRKTLR